MVPLVWHGPGGAARRREAAAVKSLVIKLPKKLSREAAARLVDALKSGLDVGVTPDGPRGPCYDFKEGALIVARRAHAPMLLFGAEFASAWRLGSWDGFYVPRPFSIVRVRCERIEPEDLDDRGTAASVLGMRLRAMNPDRLE